MFPLPALQNRLLSNETEEMDQKTNRNDSPDNFMNIFGNHLIQNSGQKIQFCNLQFVFLREMFLMSMSEDTARGEPRAFTGSCDPHPVTRVCRNTNGRPPEADHGFRDGIWSRSQSCFALPLEPPLTSTACYFELPERTEPTRSPLTSRYDMQPPGPGLVANVPPVHRFARPFRGH